jgi:flagellar FliL protein
MMAEDTPVENAEPGKSRMKLLLIIIAALIILGAGGGGAWYMYQHKSVHKEEAQHEAPHAPIFMSLETFTINLQPDPGEKYLQVELTIQVADLAEEELIKLNMPQVRNRLLLLLSSKKSSEISTVEGKKVLSGEIISELNKPFTDAGKPQKISSVFFTSFVIQ